jgi:putative flippase GtrA
MKNTFVHWLKFNLVGFIGIAVQLSALALFNHWMRGHYLLASAAALELTLLHNFVWHFHYTWRGSHGLVFTQLFRFHLSNGLVSLVGNLALMRLLVSQTHLPVLAANAIAIACCSLANFLLSHKWVFAAQQNRTTRCAYPTPDPATLPHA